MIEVTWKILVGAVAVAGVLAAIVVVAFVGLLACATGVACYVYWWAAPRNRRLLRETGRTIDARHAIDRWTRGEGTMAALSYDHLPNELWWTTKEVTVPVEPEAGIDADGWPVRDEAWVAEITRLHDELCMHDEGSKLLVNLDGLEEDLERVRTSPERFVDFYTLLWGDDGSPVRGEACPRCGYSSVGLDEVAACPECGQTLGVKPDAARATKGEDG